MTPVFLSKKSQKYSVCYVTEPEGKEMTIPLRGICEQNEDRKCEMAAHKTSAEGSMPSADRMQELAAA